MFEIGQALGEECLQEGVSVLLVPGANIKRLPLCGRNLPVYQPQYTKPYSLNSSLEDIQETVIEKLIGFLLQRGLKKHIGIKDESDPSYRMMWHFVYESPLKTIAMMGGHIVSLGMIEGILKIRNGKVFSGVFEILRSLKKPLLVTEITNHILLSVIIRMLNRFIRGVEVKMNAYLMYGLSLGLLGVSFFKDRKKTKMAIKKGWKSFLNILPQMLGIVTMVGLIFAFFNAETISRLVGNESGWFGVLISAMVGAVTLIPGFVAFPTAALVLQNGGGYMQIGAFVSALMMVGIMTVPIEIKYFGKKMTIIRNTLAFLFSLVVALVIGTVMS